MPISGECEFDGKGATARYCLNPRPKHLIRGKRHDVKLSVLFRSPSWIGHQSTPQAGAPGLKMWAVLSERNSAGDVSMDTKQRYKKRTHGACFQHVQFDQDLSIIRPKVARNWGRRFEISIFRCNDVSGHVQSCIPGMNANKYKSSACCGRRNVHTPQ